ncbi:MAG: hypothetical protein ABIL09_17485 [Gemmatimonadota bacterium]
MIGHKLLREDGSSLREEGRVRYPLPADGAPGEWVTVPGNGAYVAHTGGLLSGGYGPLAVEMECEEEVVAAGPPEGIRCWRRVRVLRAGWPPEIIPECLLRIVDAPGEHEHTGETPPTIYLDGTVRQSGGECWLYGQAQAHGQSGGECWLSEQAQAHGQSGGKCWLSEQAQAHGQSGGECWLYGQAQAHGQSGRAGLEDGEAGKEARP